MHHASDLFLNLNGISPRLGRLFDWLLAEEFGEFGFDGFGPDFVTFGVGVKVVGHDAGGESAVVFQKAGADIEIEDVFTVIEFLDHLVDLGDFAALVVEVFSTREDSEEEDFHLGLAGAQFFNDGSDAIDDLRAGVRIFAGIISANHDDGGFGFHAVEVSMLEAIENRLGAVAANADVHRFAFAVIFFPDFFGAGVFPAMSDGVANEKELGVRIFFDALVEEFSAGFPALIGLGHGRDGGMIRERRNGNGSGEKEITGGER